jgi:outer membrane murein-binding lipoprotein Lpp
VLFAWIGAVVFAVVILGFCAYELSWKSKRLHSDLSKLAALSNQLTDLQDEVSAAQSRMAEARH